MTLALAEATSNDVLNSVAYDAEDVNVDAPPGSGKTYLLESCAALSANHFGRRTLIACNSNDQADDLASRLALRFPGLNIVRLVASNVQAVPALAAYRNVIVRPQAVPGAMTTITTVAKLIESPTAPTADILMFDEAYQLKYADFLQVRGQAPRAVTIGDPGQIDPIVPVPVRHWAADAEGPHLPAPQVILARNEARRFQLPVSRRLPTDSAEIVRAAFYPNMTFTGLATPEQRRVQLRVAGVTPADGILDAVIGCGSLAAVLLPAEVAPPSDPDLIAYLVELIRRMLTRDPVVVEDDAAKPIQPSDIGVVVSRREQVSAVAGALGPLSNQVWVETANRFQGLERRVIFGIHPLSGLPRPSEFNLNPGRMCVTMSRHKALCVLLSRGGIERTLAGYIPDDDRHLGQTTDPSFVGWGAHQVVWRKMAAQERFVEL
jgi:hypothetical protein